MEAKKNILTYAGLKKLEEELHEKYRQLCEKNREKQVTTVSLEEARKNKLNLF